MRYGEVSTGAVKPSAITPNPTIGNVHNGEENTAKNVFTDEGMQISNSFPDCTYSIYKNPTKFQAARFSQFAYGNVKVDPSSGDWTDFRIAQRLSENPKAFTEKATIELQKVTLPRLLGAKSSNDIMTTDIETAKSILPESIEYLKMPSLKGMPPSVVCTLPNGENITLQEALQRHQAGTLVA